MGLRVPKKKSLESRLSEEMIWWLRRKQLWTGHVSSGGSHASPWTVAPTAVSPTLPPASHLCPRLPPQAPRGSERSQPQGPQDWVTFRSLCSVLSAAPGWGPPRAKATLGRELPPALGRINPTVTCDLLPTWSPQRGGWATGNRASTADSWTDGAFLWDLWGWSDHSRRCWGALICLSCSA